MGKSQETFNKKEKEKKRAKQRQDKQEKMDERKANLKKGKSLDEMMAYIDENGNLSTVPPDPKRKKSINQEDVQIGVAKQEAAEPEEIERTGIVTFFNESKGFGFIKDLKSDDNVFVHANQLLERIAENDKVMFETQMGLKGLSAIKVKRVTA